MAVKSAAEIVVEGLAVNGVGTLFCLPGIQNDPFFAALYDSGIRAINARHEQGVAYMALGAALATGKPQAFAVVPGPGFLNTTSALATAYATGAPVLCLAGEVATSAIGKGYGQLHELPDQMGIMSRLTKWSGRISSAVDASSQLTTAFQEMLSGRPRPVGIEVPMDVWNDKADVGSIKTAEPVAVPQADKEDILGAAELIDQSEHILIVVGGGAQGASKEVQALAERLEAPVVCYRNGQGVLDGRHPLAQNGPFGHRLWPEIDLVIGIGTRLSAQLQGWGVDDNLKVLRIDIDPEEVIRIAPADIAIIGDAATETGRLVSALEGRNVQRKRWQRIAETADALAEEVGGLTPQIDWLAAIREALGEDGIYVDELTQPGYVSRLAYPTYKPRTFVSSGYMGTLGWGYATALGVKVAKPDEPVVSVSGDGGFLFTGNEIATAVHHGINLVTIVFTDGAYGNVRRIQQQMYDNKVIASELTNPDFVAYAESFGAVGLRAEKPELLEGTIKKALTMERPAIIEVPMGDVPSPWPFLMLPKVRGA
ncbi:MAG: thiamine pyrophosphate-dependent enzyme [Pseudomonadota bacterium]|nr:thiamine pyrophosphate-dependent enzyme [Pseudomonadota bacterium]